MQIFGSDPVVMAQAAAVVEEAGADIVDINMGCPVKKVVKNGDGSALMKNLPLAEKVIRAVVGAVSIPVTVKMRTGWDDASLRHRSWPNGLKRLVPLPSPSTAGRGNNSIAARRTGRK